MHPEILSITLFGIVAAFTPGPNNFVAFYSGFNFGIKRTLPHIFGVTFGFPFLLLCVALGLINIFKLYPLIQIILKSSIARGVVLSSDINKLLPMSMLSFI